MALVQPTDAAEVDRIVQVHTREMHDQRGLLAKGVGGSTNCE